MMLTLYQYRCHCGFEYWLTFLHEPDGSLVCPECKVQEGSPTDISIEFEGITPADNDVIARKVG